MADNADPPDRIRIRGLRLVGTHGVLAEEQDRAQPFEVDIDLEMDTRAAGASDNLADTADYGAVTEAVAAVIGGPHADLLEYLAERIAVAGLEAAPSATAISVEIRKTRPPLPYEMSSAAVAIHRRRQTAHSQPDPTPSRPEP